MWQLPKKCVQYWQVSRILKRSNALGTETSLFVKGRKDGSHRNEVLNREQGILSRQASLFTNTLLEDGKPSGVMVMRNKTIYYYIIFREHL